MALGIVPCETSHFSDEKNKIHEIESVKESLLLPKPIRLGV